MQAALVGVDFGKGDFLASLEELALLSKSAGAEPVASVTGRRASPDSALFVGSGKAEEIRDTMLFDSGKLDEVEIPFKPARVVLQDFTGVPCVVDLAHMRSAMKRLARQDDPAHSGH